MRLIHKKCSCHIFRCFNKRTGSLEHVINAALFVWTFEFPKINITRCTIFRNILNHLIPLSQFSEQVYCYNCFSRSRPSLTDNRSFPAIFLTKCGQAKDFFIDDLLLINHNELRVSFQHLTNRILKALGWSDLTILNQI